MPIKYIFRSLICISALLAAFVAQAEDTDIFSQSSTVTASAPNVLLVLDNRASTNSSFGSSTKFGSEMVALATVVNALNTRFNLGVMMFTESGSPNTNTKGGYVRFAIQSMTTVAGGVATATDARNCLLKMVGSGSTCTSGNVNYTVLSTSNDAGDGAMSSISMNEAYYYFSGGTSYSGQGKVKADPLAFVSNTISGPVYRSPVSDACQKNYIIFINNGNINDSSSTSSTAMANLTAANNNTAIPVINPPDTTANNVATDEWAQFLNNSSVAAVTYTLEVGPTTNGQGPYTTQLLQSMGRQGQGGYYAATDSNTLTAALTQIFNDINAQNSVFASSSLPLSADNSGAFLNQVYMGVFRPDTQGKPRWFGNLKEYQFALDSNANLFLADRTGAGAASGTTGFAKPDAISFWTSLDDNFTYLPSSRPATSTFTSAPDAAVTAGTGGFWYFDNRGTGGSYDSADGEFVEKGGAAQQLRLAYLGYGSNKAGTARGSVGTSSASGRKVLTYTCTGLTGDLCASGTALTGAASSKTAFDSSNTDITDTLLGTTSVSITSIASSAAKSVTGLAAGDQRTVSSISKSSGVGTATVSGASLGAVGASVRITFAGAGSGLDNTYTATLTGSNTMTFTASNGTAISTSGTGTIVSDTATAQVSNHGYVVGQLVTIAGVTSASASNFNGVFAVTAVTTNSFNYKMISSVGEVATGTISSYGNIATATTSAAHGLASGSSITVSGATPTGYNGTYVLTTSGPTSTTFTYNFGSASPLTSASGTILGLIGGGRTNLINWVRGQDLRNENGDSRTTDVRASIHGDVLHSRPVVLNYNASTTDNVYLFYGGNDGVFRAVKGGQAATDGIEQWAFIPQEFFGKLKRQYNNSPLVLYSSTPSGTTPTPLPRDYFWDGPVGSYIERYKTGDTIPSGKAVGMVSKAYIFIAVRRGGRVLYALDVTDPTAPKYLWKKDCTAGSGTFCEAGLAELGQTWSQPQVIKVKGNTNPVLLFGGGYDTAEDVDSALNVVDTMGRGVFALDAFSGSLIWSAQKGTGTAYNTSTKVLPVSSMNYSIAADVIPLDRNFDGYVDRAYAADVGGNIWRFDIDSATPADWTVAKIASLGDRVSTGGGTASAATTRKFLFGMDVVLGATYDSIFIGSGDREHPLSQSGTFTSSTYPPQLVTNRVYMIKDTAITGAGLDTGSFDKCGATVTTTCTNLFDATAANFDISFPGWFVTLNLGEKVVNSPVVAGSKLLFGTNQPIITTDTDTSNNMDTTSASCSNLGKARRYSVNYLTGGASSGTDRSSIAIGGGFLPSPVTGIVEIIVNDVVTQVPFVTDNPLNPGGTQKIDINPSHKRYRSYWYEKLE